MQKFKPSTLPSDIRAVVTQKCAERSKKKEKTNITNTINEPFDDTGSIISSNGFMERSDILNSINSVIQFIHVDVFF